MGKKTLIAAVLGMAATFAAPLAVAQETGWYIGGHFGQSDVKELDETDTAWKVLAGYQINRNFAAELGYIDFGGVTLTGPGGSLSLKANAFELVGVGTFALAPRISLYGKFGFYRAETDIDANVPLVIVGQFSETNTDITFGVGVRYDLNRNLGIRGEWQRYGDVGDGATDVDVLSIGVVYRF